MNANTEGGLLQAELTFCYRTGVPDRPDRMFLRWYDDSVGFLREQSFGDHLFLLRSEDDSAAGGASVGFEWSCLDSNGTPQSLGKLCIRPQTGFDTATQILCWQMAGGVEVLVPFEQFEVRQTRKVEKVAATLADPKQAGGTLQAEFVTTVAPMTLLPTFGSDAGPQAAAICKIQLNEQWDDTQGPRRFQVQLADTCVEPLVTNYYGLFSSTTTPVGRALATSLGQAFASATDCFGNERRLYDLLPNIHRYYDTPGPNTRGNGQLFRYLQVFESALDAIRSQAESLRDRNDIEEVRADMLPLLAQWIGLAPDYTRTVLQQRMDIREAPELFRSIGTMPNLRALVQRCTGLKCRVKEFVHNVFRTYSPEQEKCPALTVDTTDSERCQSLKSNSFDNDNHYTYDTRDIDQADVIRCARDVVGVYLQPKPGEDSVQFDKSIEWLQAYLEPCRPVSIRLVYLSDPSEGTERSLTSAAVPSLSKADRPEKTE